MARQELADESKLRQDSITPEALFKYCTLVLPECRYLTTVQAQVVEAFMGRGGCVVPLGDLGANLPEQARRQLMAHPRMLRTNAVRPEDLADGPQVMIEGARRAGVGVRLTYRRDIREMHRLVLEDVPLYTVVLLEG